MTHIPFQRFGMCLFGIPLRELTGAHGEDAPANNERSSTARKSAENNKYSSSHRIMWQGASVGLCKFRSGRLDGGCSQCLYSFVRSSPAETLANPPFPASNERGSLSQDKERCTTYTSTEWWLWSMPHAVTPHSTDAHLASSACIGQLKSI